MAESECGLDDETFDVILENDGKIDTQQMLSKTEVFQKLNIDALHDNFRTGIDG